MTSKSIQSIYTDGACSGNPGPGGWATVVYFSDGSVHELGGFAAQTTNNRMEIQATIAALEFLLKAQPTEPLALYTDSEYVKNGITKWVKGWKQKGWKTSTGKPVLNQELWEILDQLNQQVSKLAKLEWKHVRGHSGDVGNDRCDEIARAFSLGAIPRLQQTVEFGSHTTNRSMTEAIQSTERTPVDLNLADPDSVPELAMVNSTSSINSDDSDLPREVRVAQLRNMVETLHMADEIASKGYLITSSELADLMDVNASAVTSRGDNWVWRNWVVSRVRREGNQILWQLERVD
ncbi:MAG: ribonuclease HI [Leptolyngbyaceae cyanobacterium CRU_2_3]|nr:ribonuclease HI [Leptolyngbyaceae cyanobacterium CRU_2_3]